MIYNNNNLFYKFRLHKGLVPQIATKLVETGQDEHENIMEKKVKLYGLLGLCVNTRLPFFEEQR